MLRRGRTTRVLGELEQDIMEACWCAEAATVRDVVTKLARRGSAYTTVMTVMNRLVDKGYLRRQAHGNVFQYTPRFTKQTFQAQSSRRIIRDLIAEFGDVAIAQFLATLESVDREKLRAFKRQLTKGERP